MAYEIVITRLMDKCLDDTLSYLINDGGGHQSAVKLVMGLETIYSYLEENPRMFQLCEDPYLESLECRQAILPNLKYAVLYQIKDNKVFIVGIRHFREEYFSKYKVLLNMD